MSLKNLLTALALVVIVQVLFAEPADQVMASITAKNDKEASLLLQSLAFSRDFAQLDKIQAKSPEVFCVKYFPGDFMSRVIFNYVESASTGAKSTLAAKGTTNPNEKNTWQWYLWDLDKTLGKRDATKDKTVKKTLQVQIDRDVAILGDALSNSSLDAQAQLSVGLYLYAYNMNSLLGVFPGSDVDPEASIAERLNAQFGEEAASILEYLFKAGVPFPDKLPESLKLEAWKREKAAFESFVKITAPDKQNEFETKDEFVARSAEWKRLGDLVMSTELILPAKLSLGSFSVEGGYFPLSIALPALDAQDQRKNPIQLVKVWGLDKADIRYYLDRMKAPFFKDKGFISWTGTATIAAVSPGSYNLKEVVVKNGKDMVTDGLWGFRIRNSRGSSSETVILIENYVKGKEYDFSGSKVSGFGASIPIMADDTYVLSGATGIPAGMWKGDLPANWAPWIGDIGPAGGIVFYDKGNNLDGWRFLEAAPSDQNAGIRWYNGSSSDINTGTTVGTGRANTEAIIAAQGSGNYAAKVCKNLTINGYSDWFLPSKDELGLMYTNLKETGLVSFGRVWLWSSSQENRSYAWVQGFSPGEQSAYDKSCGFAVRACRSF